MKNLISKNIFSVLTALLIMYLSLTGSDSFNRVSFLDFPGFDKIVHAGMYYMLMTVIILEHRMRNYPLSKLLVISLIPLSYGLLMEIFQWQFTATRSGSLFDAMADYAGILLSVLTFLLFERNGKRVFRK